MSHGKKYDRDALVDHRTYTEKKRRKKKVCSRDDVNVEVIDEEEKISITLEDQNEIPKIFDMSDYPQLNSNIIVSNLPTETLLTKSIAEVLIFKKEEIPTEIPPEIQDEEIKIPLDVTVIRQVNILSRVNFVNKQNHYQKWRKFYNEPIYRYYDIFCPDKSIDIEYFATYLYHTCMDKTLI